MGGRRLTTEDGTMIHDGLSIDTCSVCSVVNAHVPSSCSAPGTGRSIFTAPSRLLFLHYSDLGHAHCLPPPSLVLGCVSSRATTRIQTRQLIQWPH